MALVGVGRALSAHRQLILPGVIKLDPWLEPFKEELKKRYSTAQDWIKKIDETEGGLEKFSRVGVPYGIQRSTLTGTGLRKVWDKCGQSEQYHL